MKNTYTFTVFTLLFALLPGFLSAQVVYVKHNATGSNNGSSWQNAYTDLQAALSNTTTGQIWVAAGTYWPGGNNPDPSDCFVVDAALSVYGGFAGTETNLSQRNSATNPTVLSGDQEANDPLNVFDSLLFLDNALHVVYVDTLIGCTTTIDGLTIKGGITDDDNTMPNYFWRGGGIHAQSPVNIRNCHFTGNFARSGGSISLGSSCTGSEIRDCSFQWNLTSSQSSGIFADAVTDLSVRQCIFEENKTNRGVIYPFRCVNVLIDSCAFSGNQNDDGYAAAIFNWNSQNAVVSNSTFSDNVALNAGAININGSELPGIGADNFIIDNCLFEGNIVTDFGGGAIWNNSADCTIKNSHFNFNIAANGAHLFQNAPGAEIVIESCIFEQAQASGWGGAMTCYGLDANILVTDCIFDQNTATNLGGAANNGFGVNVTYQGCEFNDNRSEASAGGALALQNDSTSIAVINCVFNGNTSSSNGGAIFSGAASSSSIVVVDRSEFLGNNSEGGVGGAISVTEAGDDDISVLNLSNSIFGFNQASTQGGALNLGDTDATITSCLFFKISQTALALAVPFQTTLPTRIPSW
ncbi:MAG: hypothetical protein IPM82_11460 [Saprospiraceae bacterium]|nr:hypothetical protein [Saprospiraceae bacterium]